MSNRQSNAASADHWALVPIKHFDAPKKRLASVLNANQRCALMLAMARDVLTALSQSRQLAGVLVVSQSPQAIALAQSFNALLFAETPGTNLPGALEEAATHATTEYSAQGIFVVPADVPLIDANEIDALLVEHERVTLLPDRECVGTNGLICSPPDAIELIFDGKSFQPHYRQALNASLAPRIVANSGFALDIDRPADLERLLCVGADSHTGAFLQESGIAAHSTI